MENKRRFRATIAGKSYTIVGERSATHMNHVVEIVNQQLAQLTELAPDLENADRCILMAVNAVSDQLEKTQRIVELEAALAKYESATSPVATRESRSTVTKSSGQDRVPFTRSK